MSFELHKNGNEYTAVTTSKAGKKVVVKVSFDRLSIQPKPYYWTVSFTGKAEGYADDLGKAKTAIKQWLDEN